LVQDVKVEGKRTDQLVHQSNQGPDGVVRIEQAAVHQLDEVGNPLVPDLQHPLPGKGALLRPDPGIYRAVKERAPNPYPDLWAVHLAESIEIASCFLTFGAPSRRYRPRKI